MTIRSSGTLPASEINTELGRSASAYFNMNGSEERALAQKPSGSYGFNSFYSKSAVKQTRITLVGQGQDGYGPVRYGYAGSGKANYYHAENSSTAQSFGSISATTGIITSGTIHTIFAAKYYIDDYHFELATSRSSNGGWTSVSINTGGSLSYTLNRTGASHFQQLNAGDSNPQISGSYRWVFGASSSYHSTTNANIAGIYTMFWDARVNGRTIYLNFS